jgi:hypothetical protein
LPNLRVAEFEQRCLTEDARLAEVAACHQLLSSALSKPTPVPAGLREQICRLAVGEGRLSSSAIVDETSVLGEQPREIPATARPPEEATPETFGQGSLVPLVKQDPVRSIPSAGIELDDNLGKHVPEYLRTGSGRDWATPLSLVGLLLAMLLVGWWSLGPWESLQAILAPPAAPASPVERSEGKQSAVPSSPTMDSSQLPEASRPLPRPIPPSDDNDDKEARPSPSTHPVEKEDGATASEEATPVPPKARRSPAEGGSTKLDRPVDMNSTTSPPSPLTGEPARAAEPVPAASPATPAPPPTRPAGGASVPPPPKASPPPLAPSSLPAANPAGATTSSSEVP